MNRSRRRPGLPLVLGLAGLLLAGCGAAPAVAPPSPTPKPPPLLGLAGVSSSPVSISGPYLVSGNLGSGTRAVEAVSVPDTAEAAVSALAAAFGVPGPPISSADGLGYNLGATSGYQLTTNPTLSSFNYHPNTPTDEVGITPSVAVAEQYAEQFLEQSHVPAGGGVLPLPQLSYSHGSDRTVFFQWTLEGLPVVNILGQPQEISVDVATNRTETKELVGMSGAVPYGATAAPVRYRAMPQYLAVQLLNAGTIDPGAYVLSPENRPYPRESPTAGSAVTISSISVALVASYGTAVPVYLYQASSPAGSRTFVTCAPAPSSCVPLRFSNAGAGPSPAA